MRIQETDRILKEAKTTRRAASEPKHENMFARAWHVVTRIWQK